MNKNLRLKQLSHALFHRLCYLSCPNFELPFVLQTAASSVRSCVDTEKEGVEHVIEFASRALSETEKKYYTTEQECLAVVWSIKAAVRTPLTVLMVPTTPKRAQA